MRLDDFLAGMQIPYYGQLGDPHVADGYVRLRHPHINLEVKDEQPFESSYHTFYLVILRLIHDNLNSPLGKILKFGIEGHGFPKEGVGDIGRKTAETLEHLFVPMGIVDASGRFFHSHNYEDMVDFDGLSKAVPRYVAHIIFRTNPRVLNKVDVISVTPSNPSNVRIFDYFPRL